MTAYLIEVFTGYMGGVDELITALAMLFAPVLFDGVSNGCQIGVPEDKPGTDLFVNREKIELLGQF
ncbi:MAG TPA: hypothetical protein PKC98_20245, partial [Candidatus Melainabacteria bacterium]|nr:hypothetical protein [Candidatus Melainabacteria bacterium]